MSGVDPVLQAVARAGLALLFAATALHKLRDPHGFGVALGGYRVLPAVLVPPATRALPIFEAAAAGTLLLPRLDPLGPVIALALLCAYSGAIAWNLARGRRIDCGCLPGRRQELTPWLLARNATLAAGAALLFVEPAARAISWVDALSLAGSLALLVLLWNTVHRLGALPAPGRSA